MKRWLLCITWLFSQAASACVVQSPASFHAAHGAAPGTRPAAPDVLPAVIGRGRGIRPDGTSTSCDDIGWMTFEFGNAPPDGDVGYVFTLISGAPPGHLPSWPLATRDGTIVMSWSDGATNDQEPFSFVVNVQTVSSTGARSLPVPLTVSHQGSGILAQADGVVSALPRTLYGKCGIAEAGVELPLPTEVLACLEEAFSSSDDVERRSEASLRLIASAAAMPDKLQWERLVVRHLEEVDGSDVGMTIDLTLHRARGGYEHAEEAIRLADELLGQSMHWNRETYLRLGYTLNEVRVVAATSLWGHTQQASAGQSTDVGDRSVQAAKHRVRDYATQWYQFAQMSDQSVQEPLQFCLATGASRQRCSGTVR